MKFALYTNALSTHQMPLAREIVKRIGAKNFRYIYTGESGQKLQQSHATEEWIIKAIEHPWLEEVDVVLIGGIRPIDLMERRAAKGLKTLYQSERWYKPIGLEFRVLSSEFRVSLPGWVRMLVPSYRKMAKRFVKLVNENECVKFLPIGPHAAADFRRMGVRDDKLVPWGYFVEPSRFGTQVADATRRMGQDLNAYAQRNTADGISTSCLVVSPKQLKVLWVGRDLAWKRVKDIERGVALANKNLTTDVHLHLNYTPITFTKLTGVTLEEVRKAMREHDLYVLASNAEEGWGAALNEALEEGMSAIGTFEAGASAAMLPKERLYHAGDVRALARLIEREAHHELPKCEIGEWTAEKAVKRLLDLV